LQHKPAQNAHAQKSSAAGGTPADDSTGQNPRTCEFSRSIVGSAVPASSPKGVSFVCFRGRIRLQRGQIRLGQIWPNFQSNSTPKNTQPSINCTRQLAVRRSQACRRRACPTHDARVHLWPRLRPTGHSMTKRWCFALYLPSVSTAVPALRGSQERSLRIFASIPWRLQPAADVVAAPRGIPAHSPEPWHSEETCRPCRPQRLCSSASSRAAWWRSRRGRADPSSCRHPLSAAAALS
jgi:hypothetical protein